MRDPMIDPLSVQIGLGAQFADTSANDLWVALLMASVLAIYALHASSEKVSAKCAAHDVVEGLHCELVPVLFDYMLFFLPDGTLTIETNIR